MSQPPKAPGARPVARSKATRWRIIVLVLVHIAFAIHLAHWMDGKRTFSPVEPSEAMEFSKRSAINAGFVFFVLMILSTLVLGRFFCGWACHLVALQDLCAGLMKRMGITPRPLRSRLLALVPFIAAFYMFIWPFFERPHGLSETAVTLELDTTSFWATFPGLVVAILTLLFSGFAAVYFLGSKGFCTYACPYGAFFHTADRFAPLRIRVNDACEGCGHCTIACTSNVAVSTEVRQYGMVVDPGCMKCLDCVSVCPNDALSVSWGKPSIAVTGKKKRKARFSLGYELLLGVTFIVAFFTFRGLYGRVPFLMSLAVAGCLAFLVLRTVQLLRKERVSIPPLVLRDHEKMTGSGKFFLGAMGLVFLFWGHSAWLRYSDWQSKKAYAPLIPVRDGWFTKNRQPITPELKEQAELVVLKATAVIDGGIWETPRVRVERAWANMILGDKDTFLSDLEIASALATKDVNALAEQGHLMRVDGRPEEALGFYEQAIERDRDQAILMRYLVDAAQESGQLDRAIQFLKTQCEIRDWDPKAPEFLAMALASAGRDGEAEKALETAVRLSKPGQGPWPILVGRHRAQGNQKAANTLLKGILTEDASLVDVRAALVEGLILADDRAQAARVLAEGLSLAPQNEILVKLQSRVQP